MEITLPRIAVAALVVRSDGKVLMARKLKEGHHAHSMWEFPGGKLEYGETLVDAALRELLEETGVVGSNPDIMGLTEEFHPDGTHHWITIYIACDHSSGSGVIMEPTKCSEIGWFNAFNLPQDRRPEIKRLQTNFSGAYISSVYKRTCDADGLT